MKKPKILNFKRWINNPNKTFASKSDLVAKAFFILCIWFILVKTLFSSLYDNFSLVSEPLIGVKNIISTILMSGILAPLWEELFYRHLPLTITKGIDKKLVLPVMFMTSIIFANAHGEGYWSIMMQGGMGLLFGIVYLKNGYSYWSSVIFHSSWNLVVHFFIK